MDEAQSVPGPQGLRPDSPEGDWTGWGLSLLQEMAEIGMAALRREAERHAAAEPQAGADFMLAYARGTRAVRLSIAMAERLRDDRRERAAAARREAAEATRRLAARKAQVTGTVVAAILADGAAEDAETRARLSRLFERLEDRETVAEFDGLPFPEAVEAMCSHVGVFLGVLQDPRLFPQGWLDEDPPPLPGASEQAAATMQRIAELYGLAPAEPAADTGPPPPVPDSS